MGLADSVAPAGWGKPHRKPLWGKQRIFIGRESRDLEVTFVLMNCQDILGYFALIEPSYTRNSYQDVHLPMPGGPPIVDIVETLAAYFIVLCRSER